MLTLCQYLSHWAKVTSSKIAIKEGQHQLTYDQLNNKSNQVAHHLSSLNLKKGDRIGILSLNSIHVPCFIYGALKVSIVSVQINWWISGKELEDLIEHAEINRLIYSEDFEEIISTLKSKITTTEITHELKASSLFSQENIDYSAVEDDAFHIYTSGTTNIPKGIVLSHKNILCLTQNITCELPGMGFEQISLISIPFFNIAGAGYLSITLLNGGTVVTLPKFDAKKVFLSLKNENITNLFLPPALISDLCNIIPDNFTGFKHLKLLHYGGAPISQTLMKSAYNKFNCLLVQGYGLTETSGIVSLLRANDHEQIINADCSEIIKSAGKEILGIKSRIINDLGEIAEIGEIGELQVKGDNVISQYWKNDYSDAFVEGWFRTGDYVLKSNQGYLFVLDRKNDMIITKGINVYPSEVENIIAKHPLVEQVSVLGMPCQIYGEQVAAAIVPKTKQITKKSLTDFCKKNLSSYKIPRQWHFVNELPKNLAGKVVRRTLRSQL
jgi:acyl-CoA synthetase (AMP-forming)/AMP-acid ligase II